MKRTGSGGNQVMEKENNMRKDIKRTVAGFLAGINMMIPGAGAAASEEPTPEEIKSPAGVCDVLKGETEKGELEKLEEIEVNQRFSEFLNGEGGYSEQSLKRRLFGVSLEPDLGFHVSDPNTLFRFQSVLLFHKNVEGREILTVGVKDRNGDRKITMLDWPVEKFFELHPDSIVFFSISNRDMSKRETIRFSDKESLSLALDRLVGSVLSIKMDSDPEKYISTGGGPNYSSLYRSYFSDKKEDNRNFLAGIWWPKIKNLSTRGKKLYDSLKKKGELLTFNSYEDVITKMNSDMVDLPFINTFTCQLKKDDVLLDFSK